MSGSQAMAAKPALCVWTLRPLQAVGGIAQLAGQTFLAAVCGGFSSRWARRELVYEKRSVRVAQGGPQAPRDATSVLMVR
jgi:hypothetical protein